MSKDTKGVMIALVALLLAGTGMAAAVAMSRNQIGTPIPGSSQTSHSAKTDKSSSSSERTERELEDVEFDADKVYF